MIFRAVQTEMDRPASARIVGGTNDHLYNVYCTPESISYDGYAFYRYDLWVQKVQTTESVHFELRAQPHGPFLDVKQDVPFTLNDSRTRSGGKLLLPLHSDSNAEFLDASAVSKPQRVYLGQENALQILVTNKLPTLGLAIETVELTFKDPDDWRGKAPSIAPNLLVAENASSQVDGLILKANTRHVIPATFLSTNHEQDTEITVRIVYAAQSGGKRKESLPVIKIQFYPSFLDLLVAVVVGSLIGWVLRLVSPGAPVGRKAVLLSLAAATIGASALEMLGFFLVSFNSEFKVFGIQLDPFQFLQVFIMAMLVGLFGVNIKDTVRAAVGKLPGNAGAAAR